VSDERPSALAALCGRLFAWLQYILPQHGISRLVLKATRVRNPWFKNALIRGFLKLFDVDMRDAVQTDPLRYATFNEFFTRPLRPETRPIAPDPGAIACPVDGTVSECGAIVGNTLLQAKGRHYTLNDLLAGRSWARTFEGGSFATIYLAPFNYHRIHMPVRGRIEETWYVPGRLFSVNALTARFVPRLFARNERIVTLFETPAGAFALVMVGALNVGSMSTVWAGDIAPGSTRRGLPRGGSPRGGSPAKGAQRVLTRLPNSPSSLDKGAEMGRFNMGSTVILVFGPGRVQWRAGLGRGVEVRLGETLGVLN
jgi:phosphatidylserine decarboxylase